MCPESIGWSRNMTRILVKLQLGKTMEKYFKIGRDIAPDKMAVWYTRQVCQEGRQEIIGPRDMFAVGA